MKINQLISIIVFTTVVCFSKGQKTTKKYQPKINKYFRNVSEECVKENQVTPERIMAVYTLNINDRGAKCYVACMLYRFNATDINGNYKDKALEMLMAKPRTNTTSSGMKMVLEKCKKEDGNDRCDKAIKFTKCMYANRKEIGGSNHTISAMSANNPRWPTIPMPSIPIPTIPKPTIPMPTIPTIPHSLSLRSKPWSTT